MKKPDENISPSADSEQSNEPSNENDRRAALKKMGLYAAYTAPALIGMMTAAKAVSVSGPTGGW